MTVLNSCSCQITCSCLWCSCILWEPHKLPSPARHRHCSSPQHWMPWRTLQTYPMRDRFFVGCSDKFHSLNNLHGAQKHLPNAVSVCINQNGTVSATHWYMLELSHTSSKSSSSHLIMRLVTLSRIAWSSSWNPSSSSSSSSLSPSEGSRTLWYHSRQWIVQESKWAWIRKKKEKRKNDKAR